MGGSNATAREGGQIRYYIHIPMRISMLYLLLTFRDWMLMTNDAHTSEFDTSCNNNSDNNKQGVGNAADAHDTTTPVRAYVYSVVMCRGKAPSVVMLSCGDKGEFVPIDVGEFEARTIGYFLEVLAKRQAAAQNSGAQEAATRDHDFSWANASDADDIALSPYSALFSVLHMAQLTCKQCLLYNVEGSHFFAGASLVREELEPKEHEGVQSRNEIADAMHDRLAQAFAQARAAEAVEEGQARKGDAAAAGATGAAATDEEQWLELRASDAIVMALYFNRPLLIMPQVVERAHIEKPQFE